MLVLTRRQDESIRTGERIMVLGKLSMLISISIIAGIVTVILF